MFKLVLEKAEEQGIKLPILLDHTERKSIQKKKKSTSAFLTVLKAFDCVDHNKLENSLEIIPDHLPCILRNIYAGQEAIVRTRHKITDWF